MSAVNRAPYPRSSRRTRGARYPMAMMISTLLALALPAAAAPVRPVIVTVGSVISAPALSLPLSAPMRLPAAPSPLIAPTRLPGAPNPLPLPAPAILPNPVAAPALAAAPAFPAASAHEHFALDWSFLDKSDDDDGLAGALVPADPGPKSFPPGGAAAQLRDTASDAPKIRVNADKLFDGKREVIGVGRELAFPVSRL